METYDGLQVERITSPTRLCAIRTSWETLLMEMPDASLFLTWEWITSWWKHYHQGQELWGLAVWDKKGHLVGFAPWTIARNALGVRCVRFIGSGIVCSDHLDVLSGPDSFEAVWRALLSYLDEHKRAWDILDLEGLRQDSQSKGILAAERRGYLERDAVVCPFIILPDDWESYRKQLSRSLRQNLRRFRSHLEDEYLEEVVFQQVTEPVDLLAAIDTLAVLNQKRRHAQQLASSFDDARFVAFHREIATLALEQGWLRYYQLRVKTEVIAALYGFHYRNVFYYYQTGFDPDWEQYSPGRLLLAHAIGEAIHEGARKFDMLRGTDAYKLTWTSELRTDAHILLGRGVRGRLGVRGVALFDILKRHGRTLLPQSLQTRIEQFLATRRLSH